MRKGRYVLVLSVAALVGLNVWRYWPTSRAKPVELASSATAFRAEDFRLNVRTAPDTRLKEVHRNVFDLRLPPPPPIQKVALVTVSPPPQPVAPPEPPAKTAEQLEEEAAQAELLQIKLIGVAFRNGSGQGYLVKGDQTFLVSVGDKAERFTVEALTAEAVTLKDPRTKVGGQIPVSGK